MKFTIPTTEEANARVRDGSIGQTIESIFGTSSLRQHTSALSMVSEAGISLPTLRFHRTPELAFRALLTEGAIWQVEVRRAR
jgi:hypothetical protein